MLLYKIKIIVTRILLDMLSYQRDNDRFVMLRFVS